jgi:hypothetical protein
MAANSSCLKSGDTTLNVYKSEFAGTNKATLLTFDVDDIGAEVSELKAKGIAFEHYDSKASRPRATSTRGRVRRQPGSRPGRQHPEPHRRGLKVPS